MGSRSFQRATAPTPKPAQTPWYATKAGVITIIVLACFAVGTIWSIQSNRADKSFCDSYTSTSQIDTEYLSRCSDD